SGAGMAAPASNHSRVGCFSPCLCRAGGRVLRPGVARGAPSLWWFLTVENERMHAGVSPLPCGILAWRSGGDGTALLSDDGVLLVVGTALPGVATINVGSELRDAVPGGESGEIDEMHWHGLGELDVELVPAVDLRLHLLERPTFIILEEPGHEIDHLL